jgi:hypothetical protein
MIKRIFTIVALVLLTATMALAEVKPGAVITESFAVRQIKPEEPWKVYINAQMAGGEMRAIICKVSLPGGAVFPLVQTEINNAYRQQLSGYLSLPSEILNDLGPEELFLNVQIKDNAGRLSAPVSFPLVIDPRAQKEGPPAGVFQEVNLGHIKQAYCGRIILVDATEATKGCYSSASLPRGGVPFEQSQQINFISP